MRGSMLLDANVGPHSPSCLPRAIATLPHTTPHARAAGCNAGKGGRSCSAGKASDGYGGGGGGQHANCGNSGWDAKNDGGRGVVIVKW